MTWAEFRIRSFAFKRQREWSLQETREIVYEIHKLQYLFGKKQPPKKERFWPITDEERKKPGLTEEQLMAGIEAWREYEKERNKNG